MDWKKNIEQSVTQFCKDSEWNYIKKEEAISPEIAGMRIFDAPLIGYASAEDPLFEELKKTEVIGCHVMLPKDWLPEAKTVISFFYPFTEAVRKSNRGTIETPSSLWLHGRIEGQRFIQKASLFLLDIFQKNGALCVAPALDKRFHAAEGTEYSPEPGWKGQLFTSNWSERHAAFIGGLGTFGLSKGFITEKGIAGRFSSIITNVDLPPASRNYTGIYEYCNWCGACARNCPAHAITLEQGKNHALCREYLQKTKEKFSPRFGCGKCQTGVPCEYQIPVRRK